MLVHANCQEASSFEVSLDKVATLEPLVGELAAGKVIIKRSWQGGGCS